MTDYQDTIDLTVGKPASTLLDMNSDDLKSTDIQKLFKLEKRIRSGSFLKQITQMDCRNYTLTRITMRT